MNLLILKFVHSRNVFSDDVELDVDDGSLLDGVEIGVVEGVGMMQTWKVSAVGRHTVRLTPLMVTLPLSTVKYPCLTISFELLYLKVY